MDQKAFQGLIASLTADIAGRPLDAELAHYLNRRHGADSPLYAALKAACEAGVRDGWMCGREAAGIRFGRVIKADDATQGFSVDVVDMNDIAGPHHRHPDGEIDLIMPLTPGAEFDGHPAGWCVYGPGSMHSPTVSKGRALVLYLLPRGAIEFTPDSH